VACYRVTFYMFRAAYRQHARNIPAAVCAANPEDEQVVLETCRGR
jgi:hypothetical protein